MRLLSQGRTAFASRFYEIKERDLTLCACQLKGKQFWRSAIEVKDQQSPLTIKTEYGRKMPYNATTWTEMNQIKLCKYFKHFCFSVDSSSLLIL